MQNDDRSEFLKKKYSILDLLNHEVNTTIGGDRTLKRLERTIMSPEVLKNLSFEQIMAYYDRVMRRQEKSYAFIIDFYRVTSKSQDIQNTLKQYTIINADDSVTDAEIVDGEPREASMKQALLARLDKLIKMKEEADSNEK